MRLFGLVLVALVIATPVFSGDPLTPGIPAPGTPLPGPATPTPPRPTKPGNPCVAVAELDDFSLKSEKFVVNNFTLAEEADPKGGLAALQIAATFKNRTAESIIYSVMVTGLDENREMLWATNLKGGAEARNVGVTHDVLTVPAGTLKATVSVSLRLCTGVGAAPRAISCYRPAN
jgi:hypothetical protein